MGSNPIGSSMKKWHVYEDPTFPKRYSKASMYSCPRCSNEDIEETHSYTDSSICSYWIYKRCLGCEYAWVAGAVHAPYIPDVLKK